MSIRIATWNVNSVKARLLHVLDWLKNDRPDIALLQELKCTEDTFPKMEVEELGYNLAIHGEKTYNGVAILSKFPLSDITRGLPENVADTQSRYIEVVVNLPKGALRVASVYVPNGQDAESEKFQYKLAFLKKLHAHLQTLLTYDEAIIIGGDYNIAPADIDVHNPKLWHGSVLTHEAVRRAFRALTHLGYYDAYRLLHEDNGFSWWDYRNNAFANDDGLRIDHLLLNAQAADKLTSCAVERKLRALDKASDHTPVVAQFS